MRSAFRFIVLLACMSICASVGSRVIKKCQCVKTTQSVRRHLIADVEVYPPRPYCSTLEVILILKDKSKRCLDPSANFTQAIIRAKEMQMAAQSTFASTTAARTSAVTASASSSSSATSSVTKH